MITQQQWIDINELLKTGFSVSQASSLTGISLPTIYRLRNSGGPKQQLKRKNNIPRQIAKYEEYLETRARNGVKNGMKLFAELKERGYKGSYASVNRYLKEANRQINFRNYKPAIRYETEPGEQALMDWGSFGKLEVNGRIEKLYCFVYVLGYSRAAYIEFTVRLNLVTLEQCHIHAFQKLGIPKETVYDNMKTVVVHIENPPGGPIVRHLNQAYLDFARYYGFKVNPTAPYWPRAKGKVESGVKYVRNNFMQGMKFKRDFSSLEDLNNKATLWINYIANNRIHGTTGEKPSARWLKEKPSLYFPKDLPPYQTTTFVSRMSTRDGLIQYKYNFYSVPIEFARRKLLIKEISENGIEVLNIYHEDILVATHFMSREKGKWIAKEEHFVRKVNQTKQKLKRSKLSKEKTKIFTRSLSYYDQILLGRNI